MPPMRRCRKPPAPPPRRHDLRHRATGRIEPPAESARLTAVRAPRPQVPRRRRRKAHRAAATRAARGACPRRARRRPPAHGFRRGTSCTRYSASIASRSTQATAGDRAAGEYSNDKAGSAVVESREHFRLVAFDVDLHEPRHAMARDQRVQSRDFHVCRFRPAHVRGSGGRRGHWSTQSAESVVTVGVRSESSSFARPDARPTAAATIATPGSRP